MDLAVAALIGASAVTGIVAWTPRPGDTASTTLRIQVELRDRLLAVVQQRGTVWLSTSAPESVCAYLAGVSNSTVGFGGRIGSFECPLLPPPGRIVANLSLNLILRQVVLAAWSEGQG